MDLNQQFIKVDDVRQDLLDRILEPYKNNCKYLKKAQFQYSEGEKMGSLGRENQGLWFMQGDFSIPESCYIADTGHFNSVEFNICYNQLGYVMIAHLVENNLLEVMRDWDLETYKRRQLPNILIVKFSSTFKKPIDSSHFQGTFSINKYSARANLIVLKTECAFYDDKGGWSEGDVTLAILNGEAEKTIAHRHESVAA